MPKITNDDRGTHPIATAVVAIVLGCLFGIPWGWDGVTVGVAIGAALVAMNEVRHALRVQ